MPSLLEASNVPQEEQQEDICEPSEEVDPRSWTGCETITRKLKASCTTTR